MKNFSPEFEKHFFNNDLAFGSLCHTVPGIKVLPNNEIFSRQIINTGVKCLYCGTKYEIEPKTNCKNCGANEYRRA